MAKKKVVKPVWGGRLREHLKNNGETLANLAKKMRNPETGDERVDVTLRSWLNGNRKINLSEFLELCIQAGADPAFILFGRPLMREDVNDHLNALVHSLGSADPTAHDAYRKQAKEAKAPTKSKPRSTAKTTKT